MSVIYNGKKINADNLPHCAKCDCLILSDSTSDDIKCKPPPHRAVVKSNRQEPQDKTDYSTSSPVNVTTDSEPCKSRVKVSIQNDCDTTTDSDSKHHKSERGIKHICFKFCCKKKNNEKKKSKIDVQSDGNQTSQVKVDNKPTQSSKSEIKAPPPQKVDVKNFESEINAAVSKYITCNCHNAANNQPVNASKSSGGCNTNTIILPRDIKCSGDNCCCDLQSILKSESRQTTKQLDDLMAEVMKQRREISDMRDMLDLFMRMMREHLFMMSSMGMIDNKYRKALEETYDKTSKNSLERKSNSLSMSCNRENCPARNNNSTNQAKSANKLSNSAVTPEPEKPKKKGLFSWCK